MPLIPFPDIPALPGVPNLPIAPPGFVFPALPQVPDVGQIDADQSLTTQTPQWLITDDTGATVLEPDSVISFEYRGETKIANFPVEQGSFASYNKIALPYDMRLTLACGGSGAMSVSEFLDAIEQLKDGLTLCTVVTPDAIYSSANVIHVDYRREARQGVSLVMAQIWLQEVRIAGAGGNVQPVQGYDADPTSIGQVTPMTSTATQAAAYSQTAIA